MVPVIVAGIVYLLNELFFDYVAAEGERSVVRVWHLRPTLIWKDGEWSEWSTSRGRDASTQVYMCIRFIINFVKTLMSMVHCYLGFICG